MSTATIRASSDADQSRTAVGRWRPLKTINRLEFPVVMHDIIKFCAWAASYLAPFTFALLIGCGGAAHVSMHRVTSAPALAGTYASFIDAADDLNTTQMALLARTRNEMAFAEALSHYEAGELERTVGTLAAVARNGGPVASRSGELRSSALLLLERWSELAASGEQDATAVTEAVRGVPRRTATWAHVASVPIEFSIAGGPVVATRVNQRTSELWIDSGSSMTVLSQAVAKDASVRMRARAVATFGASGDGEHVGVGVGLLDELTVAGGTVRHLPVALAGPDLMEFKILFITLVEVEGILGWDVLKSYDVTIDYARARLTLHQLMPCQDEAPLIWFGLPIVRARAPDGQPLLLGIDTGASRSYLTNRGARKLGTAPGPKTFFVGKTALTFQGIALKPSPRNDRVLDGVLGSDAFKGASLRLNMPQRCAAIWPVPER